MTGQYGIDTAFILDPSSFILPLCIDRHRGREFPLGR